MSRKWNHGSGGKKAKGFSGGMRKHGRGGVAHNHRITIEMNRQVAEETAIKAARERRGRSEMFESVQDLFRSIRGKRRG